MGKKVELSEFQKKLLLAHCVYSFCRVKMWHLTPDQVLDVVNRCVDYYEKSKVKGGSQ